MKKFSKLFCIFIVIILSLTCALAMTACTLGGLDEIVSDDGKVSSNTDTNKPSNATGTITYEQYEVTTNSGVPTNSGSSYTEMIDSVQTSVVVIRTANSLTANVSEAGAGVLYCPLSNKSASLIITCCHVVDGAKKIQVAINDGDFDRTNDKTLDATLVGMDDEEDIAVLRISGGDYNYLTYRDTDKAPLKLGEDATAIGNPLGAGITVTKGIVSGVGRSVYMEGITMELVQTDAAINGGNSGGALFDSEGLLIGIVNAKLTGSQIDGVGYAIPVKTAIETANAIIATAGTKEEYNGLGYIEGKIRFGLMLAKRDKASVQGYTNIPALPCEGEYFYYIPKASENNGASPINPYGSVARSDKENKIMAGIFITKFVIDGVEHAITDSYDATTVLKSAKVGDKITLRCILPKSTWGGITYSQYDVEITLCQYVYGYAG